MRNLQKHLPQETDTTFSADRVKNAIKKLEPSKAMGSDGISTKMIKKLGDYGIRFITHINNTTRFLIPNT